MWGGVCKIVSACGENCRWFLLSPWQLDLEALNKHGSSRPGRPHARSELTGLQSPLSKPTKCTSWPSTFCCFLSPHSQTAGFLGNTVYPVHLAHLAVCPISISLPSVCPAWEECVLGFVMDLLYVCDVHVWVFVFDLFPSSSESNQISD